MTDFKIISQSEREVTVHYPGHDSEEQRCVYTHIGDYSDAGEIAEKLYERFVQD